MNITIKINTDNAAFQEDMTAEVLEIIRRLTLKIGRDEVTITAGEYANLKDTNGNTIGSFTVTS